MVGDRLPGVADVCNGAVYAGVYAKIGLELTVLLPGGHLRLGSGGIREGRLAETSPPGALVQRAAVFLCWGLDLTGRCPLLPQKTEGLPKRAPDVPQATRCS